MLAGLEKLLKPDEFERIRSGSLWEASAPPDPASAALDGEHQADVCVVGVVIPTRRRLHLAVSGTSVVALRQRWSGSAHRGRNGGQILPGFKWDPDDLVAKARRSTAASASWRSRVPPPISPIGSPTSTASRRLRRNCGWLTAAVNDRIRVAASRAAQ